MRNSPTSGSLALDSPWKVSFLVPRVDMMLNSPTLITLQRPCVVQLLAGMFRSWRNRLIVSGSCRFNVVSPMFSYNSMPLLIYWFSVVLCFLVFSRLGWGSPGDCFSNWDVNYFRFISPTLHLIRRHLQLLRTHLLLLPKYVSQFIGHIAWVKVAAISLLLESTDRWWSAGANPGPCLQDSLDFGFRSWVSSKNSAFMAVRSSKCKVIPLLGRFARMNAESRTAYSLLLSFGTFSNSRFGSSVCVGLMGHLCTLFTLGVTLLFC